MIFHENRLLADDSHVISYLIFCQKIGKMSQNLSSAAVVIGALRVKYLKITKIHLSAESIFILFENTADPDQVASDGFCGFCFLL